MMLTIYFNTERTSKQIINMSDKALLRTKGDGMKTRQEIEDMCRTIANDLSYGTYSAIKTD